MDHFGIGAEVVGAAKVYFRSARRTGRTTSLVDSLKNGDRVVFLTEREGRRVQRLCEERGVTIEIVVNDAVSIERLFNRGSPSNDERTIFDHSWIEKFYLDTIERAGRDIDRLQTQLSGRGEQRHAQEYVSRRRAL